MPIAPANDLIAARYSEAANESRLSVPRCVACGQYHFYPRPFCPHCWSEDLTWVDVSGDATIYSYTVIRGSSPYVLAVVELAEGPRMMTHIVDCPVDGVQIGMRVRVAFRDLGGSIMPEIGRAHV